MLYMPTGCTKRQSDYVRTRGAPLRCRRHAQLPTIIQVKTKKN